MEKAGTFRISDCTRGRVFLLAHPRRVAQVIGMTTMDQKSADGMQVAQRKVVKIRTITPLVEIEGFIDAKEVNTNGILCQKGQQVRGEVWAEQYVPKIITKHGTRVFAEKETRIQLYCLSESGRDQVVSRTSPCMNTEIEGWIIPADLVPQDLFPVAGRKPARPEPVPCNPGPV